MGKSDFDKNISNTADIDLYSFFVAVTHFFEEHRNKFQTKVTLDLTWHRENDRNSSVLSSFVKYMLNY